MKVRLVSFLAATLAARTLADVPPRPVTSNTKLSAEKSKASAADEDYLRGVQSAEGHGVTQNYALAAKYYRSAANQGHIAAQYNLGHLYENGLGVERDFKQAARWYRKAALQGDADAQNNLGALYAAGRGARRSYAEAARWYRKASDQNNPKAMSNLGMMYLQGKATKRDYVEAFQLFRRSADLGYEVAQNNLALMYANGYGVARDYIWAYAWLAIAAENLTTCDALRDRIGRQMSSDEIARAKALAAMKKAQILRARDSQ